MCGLAAVLFGVAGSAGTPGAQAVAPTRAAAAGTCVLTPANVLPMIRMSHEEKQRDLVAQVDAKLAGARGDVLVLGDSISERWPQASLDAIYPGERVLNLGIGGDHVADLLFRLDGLTTRMADGTVLGVTHWQGQRPRLVTILIGTNDLRDFKPCTIASGIVAATQRVHALYPHAKVAVLSILPRGDPVGQYGGRLAAVNALVAREAEQSRRFRFVDLTAAFSCPAETPCDLTIPIYYIHPSEQGYAQLAAALHTRLARR
jgi:platelet-activating factor acetylhydrolase IB subunit beta/gamma